MTPKLVIFDCDGGLVDSEMITNNLLRDDLTNRQVQPALCQIIT